MNEQRPTPPSAPRFLHVVWIYAGFAALWIVSTDSLLAWWNDTLPLAEVNIGKGLLFVVVTSLLLFGLLRRSTALFRESAQREQNLLNEKLQALKLLNAIADSSTDAIFAKDRHGRYLLFNKTAERNTGKLASEVLGQTDTALFPPEEATQVMADDQRVIQINTIHTWEHSLHTPAGNRIFLTTQGPLLEDNGEVSGVFGIARDITDRKRAEEQLKKLSLAVEQSPESIVITDLEARIEYVNQTFIDNTGYNRNEVIGQNPRILQSGNTPKATHDALWKALTAGETWQGELQNRRKDGSEYTERALISPLRQPDGRVSHYVAIKQDITEQKRAEAQIHRLAFYDPLTELPNRRLLLEHITQTLEISQRNHHRSALLLFNLDHFKTINDAVGATLGDALLKEIGARLRKLLYPDDVLARLSGDEFGILLPHLSHQAQTAAHQALHVAEKIKLALREPFQLEGQTLALSACMGVSLLAEHLHDNALEVLRRGDTALHHAKSQGTSQITFFDSSLEKVARQRFDIEQELRLAVTRQELRVYLQPQVNTNGRMVGAEALVRWQHPTRGLVPPGMFIPIAEDSDLIISIDAWVFAEVCRLLAQPEIAAYPLRISVNISSRHFRQPEFVSWIKQMLTESGADPARLTLEVTESLVIDNIGEVVAKMTELSTLGIHFSMDDFGTGYSSLAYLKRLPIQELKIDKTFVQDAPTDPNDAALVEIILAVASHMHLKVVAEGVETQEQADFLNQRATVIHQGYLFGKPMPVAEWVEKLQKQG